MFPSSHAVTRWSRRPGRRLLVGVLAAAFLAPAVLTAAGAQAAQPHPPSLPAAPRLLKEGVPLRGPGDPATFALYSHNSRWSVAALHSDAGSDYDLTVNDSVFTVTSDFYANQTDFVAIAPAGSGQSYKVNANLWGGSGGFDIAFNEQADDDLPFAVHSFGQVIHVGGDQWPTDYPSYRSNRGSSVAAVYDVSLVAGQNYIINALNGTGNVYLMQDDPGAYLQAANRAVVTVPAGSQCRWFRPRTSGLYGLIVTFDDGSGGYQDPMWSDVVKATAAQASGENCGGVITGR